MPRRTFDVNAFVALTGCFTGAHCNLFLLVIVRERFLLIYRNDKK